MIFWLCAMAVSVKSQLKQVRLSDVSQGWQAANEKISLRPMLPQDAESQLAFTRQPLLLPYPISSPPAVYRLNHPMAGNSGRLIRYFYLMTDILTLI